MAIVLPAFQVRRHTSIDGDIQLKLVVNALIQARKESSGDTIHLRRTEANQLTRLYRHEIVWNLEIIKHKYGSALFRIVQTEWETAKLPPKFADFTY